MLSHRHAAVLGTILASFPFVLFAQSSDHPPDVTYRTSTSEVRVSFFATDENNHAVENLNGDDFAIVDGDLVIRNFRSLNHAQETNLDLVLLVDSSESVATRFPTIVHEILSLISRMPAGDRISVIAFGGVTPTLLCSASGRVDCRTPEAERRLLSIAPAGPTPLYDSLIRAADLLSATHRPTARQAILLFSDGNDTVSRATQAEALAALASSTSLLYSIRFGEDALRYGLTLEQLSSITGGRSFPLDAGAANILDSLRNDLRTSYVVTYSLPSHEAGFHSLRILPKHNLNLRFYCRRGYLYDKQS